MRLCLLTFGSAYRVTGALRRFFENSPKIRFPSDSPGERWGHASARGLRRLMTSSPIYLLCLCADGSKFRNFDLSYLRNRSTWEGRTRYSSRSTWPALFGFVVLPVPEISRVENFRWSVYKFCEEISAGAFTFKIGTLVAETYLELYNSTFWNLIPEIEISGFESRSLSNFGRIGASGGAQPWVAERRAMQRFVSLFEAHRCRCDDFVVSLTAAPVWGREFEPRSIFAITTYSKIAQKFAAADIHVMYSRLCRYVFLYFFILLWVGAGEEVFIYLL